MTLYQVIADDFDGTPDGNGLFVRADTPQEALDLWYQHYGFERDECEPIRIDEIPADGPKGAIAWETVPCVWAPAQ